MAAVPPLATCVRTRTHAHTHTPAAHRVATELWVVANGGLRRVESFKAYKKEVLAALK